jgi:hypothetical protein
LRKSSAATRSRRSVLLPLLLLRNLLWSNKWTQDLTERVLLAQSFSPNLAQDGQQVCRPAQRSRVTWLCYFSACILVTLKFAAGLQTCCTSYAELGLKDWANATLSGLSWRWYSAQLLPTYSIGLGSTGNRTVLLHVTWTGKRGRCQKRGNYLRRGQLS